MAAEAKGGHNLVATEVEVGTLPWPTPDCKEDGERLLYAAPLDPGADSVPFVPCMIMSMSYFD